jgi:hypothetical protein
LTKTIFLVIISPRKSIYFSILHSLKDPRQLLRILLHSAGATRQRAGAINISSFPGNLLCKLSGISAEMLLSLIIGRCLFNIGYWTFIILPKTHTSGYSIYASMHNTYREIHCCFASANEILKQVQNDGLRLVAKSISEPTRQLDRFTAPSGRVAIF